MTLWMGCTCTREADRSEWVYAQGSSLTHGEREVKYDATCSPPRNFIRAPLPFPSLSYPLLLPSSFSSSALSLSQDLISNSQDISNQDALSPLTLFGSLLSQQMTSQQCKTDQITFNRKSIHQMPIQQWDYWPSMQLNKNLIEQMQIQQIVNSTTIITSSRTCGLDQLWLG